jgi:glycosyltransferase involved in cell wall biosynthesis
MKSLSVVVPTLNCAKSLPAHLDAMAEWLDLADEIVVVDSHSDDGTPELIRGRLNHPRLRLLSHPRGLYQSWNFGITQTTGEWIYISTIGDLITRPHLEHLLEVGRALGSDVVISPPTFTFEDHLKMEPPVWPIEGLLEFHGIVEPTEISPLAALYHGRRVLPDSILGSSASNLYRGDHLRSRPFPTTFKSAGDTAWSLQFALETRFCFTPRQGSSFCFHSSHYVNQNHEEYSGWCEGMRMIVNQALEGLPPQPKWAEALRLMTRLDPTDEQIREANRQWRRIRKANWIPWYFKRHAWRHRVYRNGLIQQQQTMAERLVTAIRSLPVRTLG